MIINGYQQFNNFIGDEISFKSTLNDCITHVSKICGCQGKRKAAKSEECNQLYINFVKANAEGLKEYFKEKTKDDSIKFMHNSHHYITSVKLR